ncbi:hypothetical protein GCM10027214_11140 [Stenotrophomonas tumulicola]
MTSLAIHAKRYALALLLAVLVIVPVVDASVCFSEEQSHQEVAGPGERHSDKAHPACGHGHCHHSSAFVASNGFAPGEAPLDEGGHVFYERPVAPHTPDRLIRPPRA